MPIRSRVLVRELDVPLRLPAVFHHDHGSAKIPWLQLRVGQWKVTYNRERVELERVESPPLDDSRVRLQWDISF